MMRGLLLTAFTSTLVVAVLVPIPIPPALVPVAVAVRVSRGVPVIRVPVVLALMNPVLGV